MEWLKILGVHRGGGGGGHTQYFNVVKARATPGSPASILYKYSFHYHRRTYCILNALITATDWLKTQLDSTESNCQSSSVELSLELR